MWLVLCEASDLAALWAARGLTAFGLTPIQVVTAEMLAYNQRFVQRILPSGVVSDIVLSDGRVIESAAVRGTLNRLQRIPFEHLKAAGDAERRYAESELYSLFLSWLKGLPGVMINTPTPQGLCGAFRQLSEWVWLASQAGLQTVRYTEDGIYGPETKSEGSSVTRRITVALNHCYGVQIPSDISVACIRLSRACNIAMLDVEFRVTNKGEWLFSGASPLPDLRQGGDSLIAALAIALST